MLRKEKFSGVTVLRGVGGFGSSSVYHTEKILRLSQDLPIVVEVVESNERIEGILRAFPPDETALSESADL